MRIVNEKYETINETEVDLTKGYLQSATVIKEDAEPVDDVVKFAWTDDDYEEVQMYVLNKKSEHSYNAQADTDAMMVDHEYRLTLLELGLVGGEV